MKKEYCKKNINTQIHRDLITSCIQVQEKEVPKENNRKIRDALGRRVLRISWVDRVTNSTGKSVEGKRGDDI